MTSLARAIATGVVCLAISASGWPVPADGQHTPVSDLTPEEASRPAEDWTRDQILEKGWTPYDCFDTTAPPLAPHGNRWPTNDGPGNLGTCVTYSFMADGLALEAGPPPEGPTTWFTMMPAGSSAAVTAATATWAAAADIHFTLVPDGGGPFNAAGTPGLTGNLRVASGAIPGAGVLAHGYYPPPNGVSAAGDGHFDHAWPWVTVGAAPGPPYDVETVALHEMGHMLGLTHAGTVAGDVMFPSYTGVKKTLAPGDIAFMTSIYGPAGHPPHCLGACCHGPKACADMTAADCAAQGAGWTFRGPGTQCPTQNTSTANHAGVTVVHWTDPAVNCLTSPLSPACGESFDEGFGTATDGECLGGDQPCNCCNKEALFEPGCPECPECEIQVCGVDPFCCAIAWDNVCDELAQEICSCCPGQDPGVCGGTGQGGCIPGIPIDSWMSSEDDAQLTCHQFGGVPESPPIPPGFFEPGSEPFFGDVCLAGLPIGPTPFGEYDLADTLILRSDDPFDRCDLPSPEQRTVDIEIVALNLQSIQPIDVIVNGQPTQWDVHVDLSQFPAPPGQLTATKTHCNGGTYNSQLNVQPRFTFTKLFGPGAPPGTQQVLDTGVEGIPFVQLFQEDNPPWANDLDPWLNLASGGPGCTNFHPGVVDPFVNNSCDCQPNGVRDICDIEGGGSLDCNSNRIPDECDPDGDGDGVPDDCDDCPDHPNPGQANECAGTPGEVHDIRVGKTAVPGDYTVTWGTPTCATTDNSIHYGPLAAVSVHGWSGQQCSIGNTGTHSPFSPGNGSFFFVVVGNDGSTNEGSYGKATPNLERPPHPVCGYAQALSLRCD